MPSDKTIALGDARMPLIGCGTWPLRGEKCTEVVTEALRLGYRHIDTAQGYGNEREVGEGIRRSGVPRGDIFITTKVRPELIGDGDLQRSAEESIAKLGIDRIDLLLIHWPNPKVAVRETMKALSEVKRRNLTRNIGVSNFTIANLREAVATSPEKIAAIQVEFHPYLDQSKLAAVVRENGLVLTAYSPIALGRVVDDPLLKEIGAAHGKTPVQVALRWLIQQEIVAIPKASSAARLRENLDVFDFALTAAEMERVGGLKRAKLRLINEPQWVPAWD